MNAEEEEANWRQRTGMEDSECEGGEVWPTLPSTREQARSNSRKRFRVTEF